MSGVFDEIDEAFTTEGTNETETEEGKNDTSEGEEVEGSEGESEAEEGEEKQDGKESEEEKTETEKGEKKPKNGVQKRIDEYHKRWKDEQRKNLELQSKLERLEKQPEKRKMPEAPDPRNFTNLRELEIARAVHEVEVKHVQQQIADDKRRLQEDTERAVATKIQQEMVNFPDFSEVVGRVENVSLHTDVLSGLILNDPLGVETLYWLGEHMKEAYTISKLSPAEQALALGRVAANIKARKSGKQVSGAPKPPAKVGGKGGAPVKDPGKMSPDEYVKFMNQRKKNKG